MPSSGTVCRPRWIGSAPTWPKPTLGVLDEPATAQALAGFVVRGLDCGAVDTQEVTDGGGPDRETLDRLARRLTDST